MDAGGGEETLKLDKGDLALTGGGLRDSLFISFLTGIDLLSALASFSCFVQEGLRTATFSDCFACWDLL